MVQLIVPHAAWPMHVRVQSPVVHVRLPHAFWPPLHVALQSDVVHAMLPQAPAVVQLTSQLAAFVQVMLGHAPDVEHSMLQFQPVGQLIGVPVPVIVQVCFVKSHVPAQIAGHTGASRKMRASTGREPIAQ